MTCTLTQAEERMLEMPAVAEPQTPADTFSVLVESNYCLNPECEAVIPLHNVKHEYSKNGLHRTTTAVCAHCKRRHTANAVLDGGIWRVKGVFFDDPKPLGGLVERIGQTQEIEHDKELLARAIARMDAMVQKARAALAQGRPLSDDDREQLEQLDTDCDTAAATAIRRPSSPENGKDYDQARKLRELVYSDEDPAAPPVCGDVPFGK